MAESELLETRFLRIDHGDRQFVDIDVEDIGGLSVELDGEVMQVTLKTKVNEGDWDEFRDELGNPVIHENGYRTEFFAGVTNIGIMKGFTTND